VAELRPAGRAELRTQLAGPLAARVMAVALDLVDVDAAMLLGWYRDIVGAVSAIAEGRAIDSVPPAVAELTSRVAHTIEAGQGLLAASGSALPVEAIASNAGILLFGGIETTEGMIANLFLHLLTAPAAWAAVEADRSLIANAIEESLRLEPSVVRVDRFATRD